MITHRTTYLCDQCGLTAEDYNDGVPLRWMAISRNVPARPTVHFCSWKCVASYFTQQLTDALNGNSGPKQV